MRGKQEPFRLSIVEYEDWVKDKTLMYASTFIDTGRTRTRLKMEVNIGTSELTVALGNDVLYSGPSVEEAIATFNKKLPRRRLILLVVPLAGVVLREVMRGLYLAVRRIDTEFSRYLTLRFTRKTYLLCSQMSRK